MIRSPHQEGSVKPQLGYCGQPLGHFEIGISQPTTTLTYRYNEDEWADTNPSTTRECGVMALKWGVTHFGSS